MVISNWIRGNRKKYAQKVPPECEEELLFCEGDRALEQIVLRGCGGSLTGDIQGPSGCSRVPCALG